MAKKILLGIWLMLACVSFAKAQTDVGIHFFEGTWEEVLQKAREEKKLIFLDCYGTWCGGCVNMDRRTFPLKEVGDFYNAHFINVKRNMEKGEGIQLCKRYNVVGYPTWLFINGEGFVVLSDAGFKEAPVFIELGKKALTGNQLGDEERFAKGERDGVFVKNYLHKLLTARQADNVERMLNTLYEEQDGGMLENPDYWNAFCRCAGDMNAPLSLYVVENRKKLYKMYGEEAVDQKIRNLYASISQVLNFYDQAGKKEIVSEEKKQAHFKLMASRKLPDYKELQDEINFIILLRDKQYEAAYALGEKSLKKADARRLCNWAALGERMTRDKDYRLKTASWAERALTLRSDTEFKQECEEILADLKNFPQPAFKSYRRSIPIRGY